MTFGIQLNWLRVTALICIAALAPGDVSLLAQQPAAPAETPKEVPLKTPDQLDSLVAPMALYPDPLLAQVLAASTYPLEIVQCARWLKKNDKLTGENLTKAAANEPWDPSVQALVAFPAALKLLDENIAWTTDLGNAFLDQQTDVMDAVQRMRKKAHDGGKLATTKEQKVEVKTIESKTIIEVVPSDPQVIYVPSYNPTVVYGAPAYAYPAMYYPPSPVGAYAATAAISFGVGVAMGAMWGGCCGGGGYGWNAGWSNNNININNNFQSRYTNVSGGNRTVNGGNRTNVGGDRTNIGNSNRGNSSWKHDSSHRRSQPYSNGSTALRSGGAAGDSSGRTQRSDRGTGQAADRAGQNRGGGPSATDRVGDRGQSTSQGSRTGQDRMGNRSLDSSSRQSAFGGSGSSARSQASSDRGFSSSRQSSGGAGGGRSGGGRSGGGRRR